MEMKNLIKDDTVAGGEYARLLTEILTENGFGSYTTPENLHKFYVLTDILRRENEKYNLTAVRDYRGIALLHIADSLALAGLIPEGANVLDVGAGAGFPSLPVAVVRPDLKITALDATAKKVNYINSTAGTLGLTNITAVCGRAEDKCAGDFRGKFDFVTARAVSALGILCELCVPSLKIGGTFAAMKGDRAFEELEGWEKAGKKLGFTYKEPISSDLHYGDDHNARTILIFEKTSETPAQYPRQYAQIKGKPLF